MRYKIISADKKYGLAIIDTEHLTERGVSGHLSESTVYNKLTKREASRQLSGIGRLIEAFISKWARGLYDAEYIFLKQGLKRACKGIAQFYTMSKMHNKLYTSHLIGATCRTVISILRSWIDHKLKDILLFVSTYIKDSNKF